MTTRSLFVLYWIAVLSPLYADAAISNSPSFFQFLASVERTDGTIDNVKLWSRFGVKSSLFKEYPKIDLFALESGTNSWKMLRFSDRWSCQWQYILIRFITSTSWQFAGRIDFPDEHYETPVHRLHEIGDRAWLALEHIADYGTGLFVRETVWYPLKTTLGACELRYLHDGHFVDSDGMFRQYFLLNQECGITNNQPVVILLHRVTRHIADEMGATRVVDQKEIETRFVWSVEKMKFEVSGPIIDPRIIRPELGSQRN